MPAILAKKLGMTQIFQEDGKVERVTVLEAGPCPVTGVTTPVSSSKTWVIPTFLPMIPFISPNLNSDFHG